MTRSTREPDQRPIPPAALRDENACELLRVWIAEKGLHCSLRGGWEQQAIGVPDEATWGVILATAVRHLAGTLNASGRDTATSITLIRDAIAQELADVMPDPGHVARKLH